MLCSIPISHDVAVLVNGRADELDVAFVEVRDDLYTLSQYGKGVEHDGGAHFAAREAADGDDHLAACPAPPDDPEMCYPCCLRVRVGGCSAESLLLNFAASVEDEDEDELGCGECLFRGPGKVSRHMQEDSVHATPTAVRHRAIADGTD